MTDQRGRIAPERPRVRSVEAKESAADGDKIRQAICAFANDLPDHRQPGVCRSVRDDRGVPTGLAITDPLLQNLASSADDATSSHSHELTVQNRHLKGQDVAVVLGASGRWRRR